MQASLERRLVAESLGTALLLAIVICSGIMGERLASGNVAVLHRAATEQRPRTRPATRVEPRTPAASETPWAELAPCVRRPGAARRGVGAPVASGHGALRGRDPARSVTLAESGRNVWRDGGTRARALGASDAGRGIDARLG